jgi:hypothetical protein
MTFARRKTFFEYKYHIDDNELEQISCVRDLGVILDRSLSFDSHIDRICSSGHSILGFIKRRDKEFDDISLTKMLYCSLVRSKLEYASIVWSPYTSGKIGNVESVQKQFLLFALKPLGFTGFRLPKYEERLLLIDMIPLSLRRELASTLFGFDLVRSNIRCPDLCEKIVMNEHSYDTRNKKPLVEEFHKCDFSLHNPLNECIRNFNKYNMYLLYYNQRRTGHTGLPGVFPVGPRSKKLYGPF